MKKRFPAVASALLATAMVAILAAVSLASPVAAAPSGWVRGYDTGDSATADYAFYVWNPGAFSLDDEYLNMTVKSVPLDAAGAEANWYVLVSINDGTVNYTWNKTVAVRNDAVVYANISLADPGNIFSVNDSALVCVRIQNAAYAFLDTQIDEISIYNTQMSQSVSELIPTIVSVGVLMVMVNFIRGALGQKKGGG